MHAIYKTRALESMYPARGAAMFMYELHPLEDAQESLMHMCIKHMVNHRCGR